MKPWPLIMLLCMLLPIVPFADEILDEIRRMAKGPIPTEGHPRDRWLNRLLVTK